MKYIVMECHPGFAILLDEEGRFRKAANFRYEVGRTVTDPVWMNEVPERKRQTKRWVRSGLAAAAACFVLVFGINFYENFLKPYSFIYMNINPEVEMDLNRRGTVVKVIARNEDGEKLIEGYSARGKDEVEVADDLIERAIEMGFLTDGGGISFFIDTPDESLFLEYGTELRTGVTEFLDGKLDVLLRIVDYDDREKLNEKKEMKKVAEKAPEKTAAPAASAPAAAPKRTVTPSAPARTTAPAASDYDSGNSGYDSDNDSGNSGYGDDD